MTTIINPTPSNNQPANDSGMGFFVGAVLIIIFGIAFFVYGLPLLQKAMSDGVNVNVKAPDSVKLNIEQPVQSSQ